MGSAPAGDAVLTAYAKSLIRHKAHQLHRRREFRRDEPEDLEQDLRAFLLSRAHLFDSSRASADTFADRVINSAIATLLRDRRRMKRRAEITATPLDGAKGPQHEDAHTLRDAITEADLRRRLGTATGQERAELIAAVMEAIQSLPPEDQEICRRLMAATQNAVAKQMGMSRRQMAKARERIRMHFEAAGLGTP